MIQQPIQGAVRKMFPDARVTAVRAYMDYMLVVLAFTHNGRAYRVSDSVPQFLLRDTALMARALVERAVKYILNEPDGENHGSSTG